MKSQKVYKYFKKNDEHIFIFKGKFDKYILIKSFDMTYKHSISNVYYTEEKLAVLTMTRSNCTLYYMNPYKDKYNKRINACEEVIDDADLCLLLMEV